MSHGGKRRGAGRPKNKGVYGEPTRPVRLPVSLLEDVRRFVAFKCHGQSISNCGEARAQSSSEVYESVHEQRDNHATKPQLERRRTYELPLYSSSVAAGFPSPADDHIERTLDLNDHLIRHPAATFFVRATGDSMRDAGIHSNDILIVDRSLEPVSGKIAVVALDGQLTVKRLKKSDTGTLLLMPENPDYPAIEVGEGNDIHIWGIVTSVIHQV